jgi:hypothetical protein
MKAYKNLDCRGGSCMRNQKTFLFGALWCIAVLSACFSSWDGSDESTLQYTIILIGPDGRSIPVEPTQVAPIVISVPPGTWNVEIRADATENDGFAATTLRFWGESTVTSTTTEEKFTFSINEMTPAIQVKNWGQLSSAFNGGWDAYLNKVGWNSYGNPQYIELLDDTSTTATTTAFLDGDSNKNIVLWTDKNVTIKRGNNLTTPLFQINKGTLTLGGYGGGTIIIDGDKKNINQNNNLNDSLITVVGKLIMYDGVTITNNKKSKNIVYPESNIGGGGVYVGKGGTFTMEGGTISLNDVPSTDKGHGGGVRVHGTFIMKKGRILNNTAYQGGGVRVGAGGSFTMEMKEGPIISRNASYPQGRGSGVSYSPGTFSPPSPLGDYIFNNYFIDDREGELPDQNQVDMKQ